MRASVFCARAKSVRRLPESLTFFPQGKLLRVHSQKKSIGKERENHEGNQRYEKSNHQSDCVRARLLCAFSTSAGRCLGLCHRLKQPAWFKVWTGRQPLCRRRGN